MNLPKTLRQRFEFLTSEYDFTYVGQRDIYNRGFSLLFQKDDLFLRISLEWPFMLSIMRVCAESIHEGFLWHKEDRYIEELLKDINAEVYHNITKESRLLYKRLSKDISARERKKIEDELIAIEVEATKIYLSQQR